MMLGLSLSAIFLRRWIVRMPKKFSPGSGSIDAYSIYEFRALSASEVSALYALESPVSGAPSAPAHSLTFSLRTPTDQRFCLRLRLIRANSPSSGGWLRASVGSHAGGPLPKPVPRRRAPSLRFHQKRRFPVGVRKAGQLGLGRYGRPQPDRPNRSLGGHSGFERGTTTALFLKEDGSLWGMGKNDNGQLGLGDKTDRNATTRIVASGVTWIAAGDHHSLFLKEDGSLWSMGYNGFGQLGNGDQTDQSLPFQVKMPQWGGWTGWPRDATIPSSFKTTVRFGAWDATTRTNSAWSTKAG